MGEATVGRRGVATLMLTNVVGSSGLLERSAPADRAMVPAGLRSLAPGGAIRLGRTTADLAVDDLPTDAPRVDLGARLGPIDRSEWVFELVAEGI